MAHDLIRGTNDGKDWSIGASITTSTDDVDDRLRMLTTDTNNLNEDITGWWKRRQGDGAAGRFVNQWIEWRNAAYKFVRSWKEGPFYKIKLAWNYADNADARIHELAEWRRRWENLSGERATAPASVPPPLPKSKGGGGSGGGGPWKWVGLLGLGGIAALLAAKKIGGSS
jgi:hypothetical protein